MTHHFLHFSDFIFISFICVMFPFHMNFEFSFRRFRRNTCVLSAIPIMNQWAAPSVICRFCSYPSYRIHMNLKYFLSIIIILYMLHNIIFFSSYYMKISCIFSISITIFFSIIHIYTYSFSCSNILSYLFDIFSQQPTTNEKSLLNFYQILLLFVNNFF